MEYSVSLEGARAFPREPVARTRPSGTTRRMSARSHHRTIVLRLMWFSFCAFLGGLLYFGWINRNERHWVPETGLGYWFGIAGAAALLALLLYPLRKRFRSIHFIGSVPAWFRLHMALGLLGPSLVLLHCNFRSESLNASVALNAMLIVAGSGLIGRFLYSHVHSTLSGKRLAAATLFEENLSDHEIERSNPYFGLSQRSLAQVSAVTKNALVPPPELFAAIGHASLIRWQARQLARSLRREIKVRHTELSRAGTASRRQLKHERQEFERDVAAHLAAVRKVATLAIHERLFSLWHFLHLPLFLMLVIAAIVHVIAVHLY